MIIIIMDISAIDGYISTAEELLDMMHKELQPRVKTCDAVELQTVNYLSGPCYSDRV